MIKGLIEIRSNGSKWGGKKPDSLPKLVERLNTLTLEDTACAAEMPNGTREFLGNFVEESAVFCILVKRDSEADKILLKAFRANRAYKSK